MSHNSEQMVLSILCEHSQRANLRLGRAQRWGNLNMGRIPQSTTRGRIPLFPLPPPSANCPPPTEEAKRRLPKLTPHISLSILFTGQGIKLSNNSCTCTVASKIHGLVNQ